MKILNLKKHKAWVTSFWSGFIYIIPTVWFSWTSKLSCGEDERGKYAQINKVDIGDVMYASDKLEIGFNLLGWCINIDIHFNLEKI